MNGTALRLLSTMDTAMEETREDRRSGADRRESSVSPFANPLLYIAACAVLLTVCSLLLTIGLSILSGINSRLTTIDTNTQATMLGITRQGTQIETLKEQMRDVQKIVDQNEKTQRDYNYNLSTRIGKVEVKTGMPSGGAQ